MGDEIARAVGAGGGSTITIAGKECTVRPLGIRELTEVERDCAERYKRQYLKTFADNMDLLPEADRSKMMMEKVDQVARWDVDALPPKFVHDPSRTKITEKLKEWLTERIEVAKDATELHLQRAVATLLDQDTLTAAEYTKLTGAKPPQAKVPYVNWWITGSYDGMVTFLWTCFKHNGVTREQVIDEVGGNLFALSNLTREIERLSAPKVGNG